MRCQFSTDFTSMPLSLGEQAGSPLQPLGDNKGSPLQTITQGTNELL